MKIWTHWKDTRNGRSNKKEKKKDSYKAVSPSGKKTNLAPMHIFLEVEQ